MQRYATEADMARDALSAWDNGASNPRGLARALVEMIDRYVELREGSDGCRRRPPIMVLLAQLEWLLGVGIGGLEGVKPAQWDAYLAECRALAAGEPSIGGAA